MTDLIDTESITQSDLESIFKCVNRPDASPVSGTAACSFQGMGTRTRTTFIKALKQLGVDTIELPAFLDTSEQARDLAGYLDIYYDLYIIRYSDHEKLKAFADYSNRPVINAMSSIEHPCEAIADAYWFDTEIKQLNSSRIVLWGPMTNVLRSWRNVAQAGGAEVEIVSDADDLPESVDLVITDGWPPPLPGRTWQGLTLDHLKEMGHPVLLPTPPFTVGEELLFDPLDYDGFAGYAQKQCLLDVQKAIIEWAIKTPRK